SWASSSTRRLNSSHDSSRLTYLCVSISASAVECFAQENAVAHAARADDQSQVAAEDHDLLDDDGAGQDDVGALGLEPTNRAPLALGEALEALADLGDVGLRQVQTVPVLALPAVRPAEVNAGQRADGGAPAHHHLAALRGREDALKLRPALGANGLERPRLGPIVVEKAARHSHDAQWQARRGDPPPPAHPAQLQAGPAQVRNDAIPEGQAVQRGVDAEP